MDDIDRAAARQSCHSWYDRPTVNRVPRAGTLVLSKTTPSGVHRGER
jgi:hypothetical protein